MLIRVNVTSNNTKIHEQVVTNKTEVAAFILK